MRVVGSPQLIVLRKKYFNTEARIGKCRGRGEQEGVDTCKNKTAHV
jgi:hypothetical protein